MASKTSQQGLTALAEHLVGAAQQAAQAIERLLPAGDELVLSTGATYRLARVTWELTAWYGADDLASYDSDLTATVLVRRAEALYDPRYTGQPPPEARDTWLAGDGMRDLDSGEHIHLAGHATLLAFAREREELLERIAALEMSDQEAIYRLTGPPGA